MTEKPGSIEFSILSQKKDENLQKYYYQIEALLLGISNWDQISHNRKNRVILYNKEQYILKNIIAKFGFKLKILKRYQYMIKYRVDSMHNLYKLLNKAKAYVDILNAKIEMQKKLKLKSGYKAFKTFQAIVASKQNY